MISPKPTESRISIVIPLYNSPKSPEIMNERLEPILEEMAIPWKILYVDDGSIDFESTRQNLERLTSGKSGTGWISLKRNGGQQKAVLAGMKTVVEILGGDENHLVLTMDDDLAHPPEQIPKMLKEMEEGWDLLYAVPENRAADEAAVRGGRFLRDLFFKKAMGAPDGLKIGSFRVFRGNLIREIVRDGYHKTVDPQDLRAVRSFVYISALAFHNTKNATHISYVSPPGLENRKLSRYTFFKRILLLTKLVLFYSPVTGKLMNRYREWKAPRYQEIKAEGGWVLKERKAQ